MIEKYKKSIIAGLVLLWFVILVVGTYALNNWWATKGGN